MLFGEAVETAGGHDRDAIGLGHAGQLRRHACRLADHGKAGLLPFSAVEHESIGLVAHGVEKFLRAHPHVRRDDRAAVVADCLHGNKTGAAGAHQMLAQARIGVLGLLVAVSTDQAIENLPQRQRQVIGVFTEDGVDAREQLKSTLLRRPCRESTRARTSALCSAK